MSNNKNKLYLHDSIVENKSESNENKVYNKKLIRPNFEKHFDKKLKNKPMSTFSVDNKLSRKMLNYEINVDFPGVEKNMLWIQTNWPVK